MSSPRSASAGVLMLCGLASSAHALDIVINAGTALQNNTAALAAFNRAAVTWESRMSDPITVTITANLQNMGANVIGSTSTVLLSDTYNVIRNQLVSDAANEADDAVVTQLPTAANFNVRLPANKTFSGNIWISKANAKAMGFTGLDTDFGTSDASINFNQQFSFDYSRSNGISASTMDFEFVALHEIGHALGFTSIVDQVAFLPGSAPVEVLDLFRFRPGEAPTSAAQFAAALRSAEPGVAAVLSDAANAWALSTGVAGDGNQASHWKADDLTGIYIGGMDPTLALGALQFLTEADFRAMDLIGYEVSAPGSPSVPEPSVAGFGVLATGLLLRRRKR